MKTYVKIYYDYFKITPGEVILCEVCEKQAVDIHHIKARGMGGSKTKNNISNLMALCRDCHDKYGDKKQYLEYLQEIHDKKLLNQ